ncbi:MAG: hypothetical protein ACAH24_29580 [Hyphomicrobiaceae bacterium]
MLIISSVVLRAVLPRNGEKSGRPELLDIVVSLLIAGGMTSGLLLTLGALLG